MVGIDALSKLLYRKMQVRSGRVPCGSTFSDDEARPDFFPDFVVDFGDAFIPLQKDDFQSGVVFRELESCPVFVVVCDNRVALQKFLDVVRFQFF